MLKYLVVASAFLMLLGQSKSNAGESGPVFVGAKKSCVKKTECPKEAEARAKAALALAVANKHVNISVIKPNCGCGENCKCPPGVCPDCEAGTFLKNVTPNLVVAPKKIDIQPTQPQVTQPTYYYHNGILYRCDSGTCQPNFSGRSK